MLGAVEHLQPPIMWVSAVGFAHLLVLGKAVPSKPGQARTPAVLNPHSPNETHCFTPAKNLAPYSNLNSIVPDGKEKQNLNGLLPSLVHHQTLPLKHHSTGQLRIHYKPTVIGNS